MRWSNPSPRVRDGKTTPKTTAKGSETGEKSRQVIHREVPDTPGARTRQDWKSRVPDTNSRDKCIRSESRLGSSSIVELPQQKGSRGGRDVRELVKGQRTRRIEVGKSVLRPEVNSRDGAKRALTRMKTPVRSSPVPLFFGRPKSGRNLVARRSTFPSKGVSKSVDVRLGRRP